MTHTDHGNKFSRENDLVCTSGFPCSTLDESGLLCLRWDISITATSAKTIAVRVRLFKNTKGKSWFYILLFQTGVTWKSY